LQRFYDSCIFRVFRVRVS